MALRIDDVDLIRDRTLVERFQAGDESAFDELYTRYYRRLERFCVKRVGDAAEAEEVAQEAFARAYRAMPRLGGERRFYPWVSVIAARLCVDTHRRRARTQPSDDIDMGSTDGGHDAIMRQVDITHLGLAMNRLGSRHREVLQFREHEGWSYQRIAEHYDVSLGTVEALLFRARKALRREFLAVAGDTPRGLMAVPALAWIARSAAGLRSKIALGRHLPALLSSGAVAVAVGSVALLGSGIVPLTRPAHLGGPAPAISVGIAHATPAGSASVEPVRGTSIVATTATTSAATTGPSRSRRATPTATPLPGLTRTAGDTTGPAEHGDVSVDVDAARAIVNIPSTVGETSDGLIKAVNK